MKLTRSLSLKRLLLVLLCLLSGHKVTAASAQSGTDGVSVLKRSLQEPSTMHHTSQTEPHQIGIVNNKLSLTESHEQPRIAKTNLRGRRSVDNVQPQHRRQLPGGYNIDPNSAEAGFAAGVLCMFLLLLWLLCCCCGGCRCSLWDCVALACLWEICCDGNPGIDRSFIMM